MKKLSIGIGVFSIIFLLISMTTTVPAAQSKPFMTTIDTIEDLKSEVSSIEETNDIKAVEGIIDLLIQLITVVINLVIEIVKVVQNIMTLVAIIQSLINAAQLLFDMIGQLIDLISQLFNPEPSIA
jgi:hypothetical protein